MKLKSHDHAHIFKYLGGVMLSHPPKEGTIKKIGDIELEYEGRRSFGRGGYDRPPREMHKVTCSNCGQEAEVPFKPDGTRPVYCRDCYQKLRPRRY